MTVENQTYTQGSGNQATSTATNGTQLVSDYDGQDTYSATKTNEGRLHIPRAVLPASTSPAAWAIELSEVCHR